MFDRKKLSRGHPILGLDAVKIFWYGRVSCTDPVSRTQKVLVVATPGIFVLNEWNSEVKRFIPFSDIRFIRMESDQAQFFSPEQCTSLTCPEVEQIVKIVLGARHLLFGNSEILRVVVPGEVTMGAVTPKMDCVLAERFLAFAGEIPKKVFDEESVMATYDNLKEGNIALWNCEKTTFRALAMAISSDDNVTKLVIRDIDLCDYAEHLLELFTKKSFPTLVLRCVLFRDDFNDFTDSIKDDRIMNPETVEFDDCDLSTSSVSWIFQGFGCLSKSVKKVLMTQCLFNIGSLESILRSLLSLRCFQELREISFKNMPLTKMLQLSVMKLLKSNFTASAMGLKTLRLIDCGIVPNEAIPILEPFGKTLRIVDWSFNKFIEFPSTPELYDIRQIVLKAVKWTSQSFLTFMKAIAETANYVDALTMSEMKIEADDMGLVYGGLAGIAETKLKFLGWINMPMAQWNMTSYFAFLKRQPQLVHIELTGSVSAPKTMDILEAFVKEKRIETFKLRRGIGRPLRKALIPVLRAFLVKQSLATLDITGHGVGSDGLVVILQLARTCLESVFFDGSDASGSGVVMTMLKDLMASPITEASWPAVDAGRLIDRLPEHQRYCLVDRFETLATEFKARFVQTRKAATWKDSPPYAVISELRGKDSVIAALKHRDVNIERQMAECRCPKNSEDKLEQMYNTFCDSVSLDSLIKSM